jgi:large subunit ribosomal protein L24e
MVTKKKCSFCGSDIDPGTGKMAVEQSGTVSFYCSSKCEKNVFIKRSARKVKWTAEYRKEKAIRVQHLSETKSKKVESTETPKKEAPKKEVTKAKPKAKSKS